jgi:hypothetical protein
MSDEKVKITIRNNGTLLTSMVVRPSQSVGVELLRSNLSATARTENASSIQRFRRTSYR